MPNPISADRIWSNPKVLALHTCKTYKNYGIDGSGKAFRLLTAVNLLIALEDVRDKVIPTLTIPFLIQHGTCDYGVPITGSELLYEKSLTVQKDKEFIRIDGAYHDLLADNQANYVVQNILNWINKRI